MRQLKVLFLQTASEFETYVHLFSLYFIAYLHVLSKLYPLSVQIRAMYLVRSRPAKSTRCMA